MIDPISISFMTIAGVSVVVSFVNSYPSMRRRFKNWYREKTRYLMRVSQLTNKALYYQIVKQLAPYFQMLQNKRPITFGDDTHTFIYSLPDYDSEYIITTNNTEMYVRSVMIDSVELLELSCDENNKKILDDFMKQMTDAIKSKEKEIII